MTTSRRDVLLAGAAALPATLALSAVARGQRPAAMPASEDPLFVPCLLIGGRKQIENCTYAMPKLMSADAKAFAKSEIEEHETTKAKLKAQGYDYPVTAGGTATGRTAGDTATAARPAYKVMVGTATPSPDAAGMVVIDHEVADQCIANFRKEFDEHAGVKKGDKFFVGQQLITHAMLPDQVQTFRKHASPMMEPVLAEGQTIIETHIATLKKIMAYLDVMTAGQR